VAKRDLVYGQRTIERILREMQQPAELEHQYALAVLAQALRLAATRPTPQAPMAARNMNVEGNSIGPSAAGAAADVAIGSEFGSEKYAQFQHRRAPRGLWLYPAAEGTEALAATDRALEQTLEKMISG
jgi:hypothetical protein